MKTRLALITTCLLVTDSLLAHARFTLNGSVPPRNNRDDVKEATAPCGGAPLPTGARTTLQAGQLIEVQWEETVEHPAKYRIGFSRDATDVFADTLMDVDQFANDAAAARTQDKIGAASRAAPHRYTYSIRIPSTPCDKCAIQLIQRMFDRNPPTNYYSCADIRIVATHVGTTLDTPKNFKVQIKSKP